MSHEWRHSGFSVEDIEKFRLVYRRSVKFATFWFLNQLIWSIFGHFMAIWSSKIEKNCTPPPSDPLSCSPLKEFSQRGIPRSKISHRIFPADFWYRFLKKGPRSPLSLCPGGASPLTFRRIGGKNVQSPLGFCPGGASPLGFRGVSGSLGGGVSFLKKKKFFQFVF